MSALRHFTRLSAMLLVLLTLSLPPSLMAIVSPELFNQRAEKSKIKAIAIVKDIQAIEEKDGAERRVVTFKLERRIGESPVPEEFIGTCSTMVKGRAKGLGETLFFNPVKGKRFFVTVSDDNEISSLTPASKRLVDALERTPQKVKFQVGQAYVDDGADKHIEKGEELLARKQYPQAAIEAGKAVQACPLYDKAYHLKGRVFKEIGKYDSAERDFSKAIELNPDSLDAYYQRGICRVNLGREQSGIEDFDKVLDASPSDMQALYCRATARKFIGQSEKALADYKRIQDAGGDGGGIVARQIALIHYEAGTDGELSKAIPQFVKALKMNPDDMYAAIFLHMAEARLKKPSGGIKDFAERHKDSKEWPMPAVRLLAGKCDESDCMKEAGAGKGDEWQRSGAYYYIGMKRLLEGERGKAAEAFNACLKLSDSKSLEGIYAKRELERLSAPTPKKP